MPPAALADLVRGVRVEAVTGAQLLDQLTTKLGLLGLFSLSDVEFSQSIASATDHQVVEPHALPTATKRIERLTQIHQTEMEGRRSNTATTWQRIRELHAKRFG